MHELAAVRDMIWKVLDHSGGRPVRFVELDLGELTTYKEEPVRYYFDKLRTQELKDSKLVINAVPGALQCDECKKEHDIDIPLAMCPECGSINVKIISGNDFLIRRIGVKNVRRMRMQ